MSAPEAASRPLATRPALWAQLVGTFFYIGYLKPGPGTWASVATALIWGFTLAQVPLDIGIHGRAYSGAAIVTATAAVIVTLIGIPAGTAVSRAIQRKDPSIVVIDEVAGQLVALIACPVSWKAALAALILFRAFDITKPPPVRQLERLPEGTGIMLDDIGAGIYAWIVLHIVMHYGFLH
jgi:phosphatidylglycerophosphatase A